MLIKVTVPNTGRDRMDIKISPYIMNWVTSEAFSSENEDRTEPAAADMRPKTI